MVKLGSARRASCQGINNPGDFWRPQRIFSCRCWRHSPRIMPCWICHSWIRDKWAMINSRLVFSDHEVVECKIITWMKQHGSRKITQNFNKAGLFRKLLVHVQCETALKDKNLGRAHWSLRTASSKHKVCPSQCTLSWAGMIKSQTGWEGNSWASTNAKATQEGHRDTVRASRLEVSKSSSAAVEIVADVKHKQSSARMSAAKEQRWGPSGVIPEIINASCLDIGHSTDLGRMRGAIVKQRNPCYFIIQNVINGN